MKPSNNPSSPPRTLPVSRSLARCWLFPLQAVSFIGAASVAFAQAPYIITATAGAATQTWNLQIGTSAAVATNNFNTLNGAGGVFEWMRNQKGASSDSIKRHVHIQFPSGTFYIDGSISPSGRTRGRGEVGASYCLFEFASGANWTEFVFTGTPVVGSDTTPQKYNLITMLRFASGGGVPAPGSEQWGHLSEFGFAGSTGNTKGTYLVGGDLHNATSGLCFDRWVAFDIRNCSALQMSGNLHLRRDPAFAPGSDKVVAVASSGGAADSSYDPDGNPDTDNSIPYTPTFERNGMTNGGFERLKMTNFNLGMFGEEYSSCTKLAHDTFTNVSIKKLEMFGCHRCFIFARNHSDALSIEDFYGEAAETSYLYGVRAINFGTAEFRSTAPTTTGRAPKFLEVDRSEIYFDTLKTHVANANACYSLLNASTEAGIVIKTIDQVTGTAAPKSGCLVTAARIDAIASATGVAEDRSTETNLTILQTGANARTVSLVGLGHQRPYVTTTPIQRKIRIGDVEQVGFGGPLFTTYSPNPDNVVKVLASDFGGGSITLVDTTDKIWLNIKHPTTGAPQTNYYKIQNNALSAW